MTTATTGNILIVDDEASVRHAVERRLRKEEYEIYSAGDAADADKILDQDPIDVILCDQDMPGRTGIDFLLDAAKKHPHQRRLMISGRFQSGDVARAIETAEEAALARSLSADIAQGYYFSKPKSKSDVQQWIDDGCSGAMQ